MEKSEIPFFTATELAGLIKSREVSSVEATQAYLDRIDAVDSQLNSYITVCREEALDQARSAEDQIAAGNYRGPMHGIPVGVKDQFNTKGILTTGGSSILKDFVPDEDSTVVSKLKNAGAVVLGKLNMSEYAMGDAFHHPYGRPRNPWDLSRNPGTSSSGSGAATAAHLCATSLGEDTGGSIRGPAAFCGLAGIRPSYGTVSRYGVLPASWSMDTVGPITRTVEDCAITLQAIAGYDPNDKYTWNQPVPDYQQALAGDITGIRVGLLTEKTYSDDVDREVRDAVVAASGVLGELGAPVKTVSLPIIVHGGTASKCITDMEGAAVHYERLKTQIGDYDHNTRVRLLTAILTPAQSYYKAQKFREMLRQELLELLKEVDVVVLPPSPSAAPKIPDGPGIKSQEDAHSRMAGIRSFTGPFNLASVPAISVPCGFTSDNMPISLQIVGRPFEDATVMKVAHAYEQATTWHTRRPPI